MLPKLKVFQSTEKSGLATTLLEVSCIAFETRATSQLCDGQVWSSTHITKLIELTQNHTSCFKGQAHGISLNLLMRSFFT